MNNSFFRYLQFDLSDDRQVVYFRYELHHDNQISALTESLTFPVALSNTAEQLASLRALHLALGISYYKIFLPPRIEHHYAMNEAEADFWNDVWQHGLGEFLYANKLSVEQLAAFAPQDGTSYDSSKTHDISYAGALLGIGGGKDSIVAGELLKTLKVPLEGFVMATGEQRGQAQAVADVMDVPLHTVNRVLDRQLLVLQEQPGAYKGHIPISLIFGLVGTTLAIASNKQYVIVANEASASIPRAHWQGRDVNHQWSKSLTFERALQGFVHSNISPAVTYFSAVRQLTSVGVAKLFAAYQQYYEVFTSDNFIFRIDPAKRPSARWSLESPKSLSSFILLAPWINEADMLRIFGLDFLGQSSLRTLFEALTGISGEPPLDCVGTVDELVLSLNLVAEQGRFQKSSLMQLAVEQHIIRCENWQLKLQDALTLQSEQALPENLISQITTLLEKEL
jgi:hypothetical protein